MQSQYGTSGVLYCTTAVGWFLPVLTRLDKTRSHPHEGRNHPVLPHIPAGYHVNHSDVSITSAAPCDECEQHDNRIYASTTGTTGTWGR